MMNAYEQARNFNDDWRWEAPTGLPTYTPDLVGTTVGGKPVLPHGPNEPGTVAWQLDTGTAVTPHKGVITYAFADQAHSTGIYNSPHWNQIFDFYEAPGYSPFTAVQRTAARISIQTWDDLIAPTFKEVNGIGAADVTFQNSYTNNPAEGAHAYYPYSWGYPAFDHNQSDVWTNDPRVDPSLEQVYPGGYGMWAVNHELGHAFGLSHPGSYNASDDDDGDGVADPITYQNDAYYFQDSHQYTIMSYFDSYNTGAQPIDWNIMRVLYPSTPMVDDAFVIQQKYGADMTTRTGNTTYGFNATSDVKIEAMRFNPGEVATVFTIWDAKGNDTLDLSGYYTDSVIDLREGGYSSAGGWGAYSPALAGTDPRDLTPSEFLSIVNANNAAVGLGARVGPGVYPTYLYDLYLTGNVNRINADGTTYHDANGNTVLLNGGVSWMDITGSDDANFLMQQNIGIAYGAIIENAIGGHGDDRINGNQANNSFTGGDGADTFIIADYTGDVLPRVTGGFETVNDTSVDRILDFDRTEGDKIDLSDLGVQFSNLTFNNATDTVTVDMPGDHTLQFIIVGASNIQASDFYFG